MHNPSLRCKWKHFQMTCHIYRLYKPESAFWNNMTSEYEIKMGKSLYLQTVDKIFIVIRWKCEIFKNQANEVHYFLHSPYTSVSDFISLHISDPLKIWFKIIYININKFSKQHFKPIRHPQNRESPQVQHCLIPHNSFPLLF